jgi:formimidoylglutamate deiminase
MATWPKMKRIDCDWLLGEGGWRARQRLRVSDSGLIESIEPADAERAEVHLSGWVVPGMCNVHSHAHQRVIAGLTAWREAGQSSFWSWREQMYRVVRSLGVEDLATIAGFLQIELLEGGYTSIGEFHYLHQLQDAGAEAVSLALLQSARVSGCALTLLPVWYRYGGFDRRSPSASQRPFELSGAALCELVESLDRECVDAPLVQIGVAPHSLRAVAPEDLEELLGQIGRRSVHIHIAEQQAEVDDCLHHTGLRPIELLFDRCRPDADWCLIHATHAQAHELDLMAKSGAIVGVCPTTEADLGDGVFPARDWLARDGSMAIGSDSHVATAAPLELRQLEWSQRLEHQQRNLLIRSPDRHLGASLWSHCAQAGARALKQNAGALCVGRRADLVELDPAHPLLEGLTPDQALDSLVTAWQSGMIRSVWVQGEARVRDGRHLHRGEFQQRFASLRARIMRPS